MKAETVQIGALGPVNGMNEPHPEGSYIRIAIRPAHSEGNAYLISRGGAEVLLAELTGVLKIAKDAAERLAGAAAEREAVLAIVAEVGSVFTPISAPRKICDDLIRRIRQRGEEGK